MAVLALLLGFLIPGFGVSFLTPPALPDIKDEVARPGDKLPAPFAKKVLFIVVDGFRADVAFDAERVPIVSELCKRGACGTAIGSQISITVMGVLATATGQTNDFRWIFLDFSPHEYPGPSWFRTARSAGRSTGHFGDDTWSMLFRSSIDLIAARSGLPRWLYYKEAVHEVDNLHFDRAGYHVTAHQPDLSTMHLVGVDHAGHRFGPFSERATNRLAQLDRNIRGLMAKADPDTVVVITADHGASRTGNHAGAGVDARTTPVVIVGPGIRHVEGLDLDLRDWSVFVPEILGAPIPGHSIGIMPPGVLDEPASQAAARLLRNAWSMDRLKNVIAAEGHDRFVSYFPGPETLREAEEQLRAGDADGASTTARAWMNEFRQQWERAVAGWRLPFLAVTLGMALFLCWLAVRAWFRPEGISEPGDRSSRGSILLGAVVLGAALAVAALTQSAPEAPDPELRADLYGLFGLLGAMLVAPLALKLTASRGLDRLDAFGVAMTGASVMVVLGTDKIMPGLAVTPLVAALLLASSPERRGILLGLAGAWLLVALDSFDYRGQLPTGRGGLGLATYGGDIVGSVALLALGAIRARRAFKDEECTMSRALRLTLACAAMLTLVVAIATMLQSFEVRRSRLPYLPLELAGGTVVIMLLAARTGAARHLLPVLAASVWVTFAVRGQVLGMVGWWVAAELLARTRVVARGSARDLASIAVIVALARFALISLFTGQISMDNLEIPVALMGNPEIDEPLGAVHVFLKIAQPTLLVLSVLWVAVPRGAGTRLGRWVLAVILADIIGLFVQLLTMDTAMIPAYARAEEVIYGTAMLALFLVATILSAVLCRRAPPAPAGEPAPASAEPG